MPSTVNGMKLVAQEWRDTILLRYGIEPPNLLRHWDSYGAEFPISHDLDYNKGVIVTS